MAYLHRSKHLFKVLNGQGLNANLIICRSAANLNLKVLPLDYWRPGPYPYTAEQREEAAKRYGMLPEDYTVFPPDGRDFGDYPAIPDRKRSEREQFYAWDEPLFQRDYNDPVPMNFDHACRSWYNDPTDTKWTNLPLSGALFKVFKMFGLLVLLQYIWECVTLPLGPVAAERQFPQEGVTHYTFAKPDELDEDKLKIFTEDKGIRPFPTFLFYGNNMFLK